MKLRSDQLVGLLIAAAWATGMLIEYVLGINPYFDQALYVSILLSLGATFYVSHYVSVRVTKKLVARYGAEVEDNPHMRRTYRTGSFQTYYAVLFLISALFVFSVYDGVLGKTSIVMLLTFGAVAFASTVDAVHDYRAWIFVRKEVARKEGPHARPAGRHKKRARAT